MMTTEGPARSADHRATPPSGARLLVRSAATTALLGLVGALVAAVVDGRAAALGVVVGATLAVVVLAGGSLALDGVARLLPAASLLVALLTFGLQVVLVLVALVSLERSGLLGGSLERQWLGGALIGATLLWLAVQLRLHTTARVPAFDLPDDSPRRADEGGH